MWGGGINQRVSPRKPLQTPVIFQDEFGADFMYFISENISTSGIYIQNKLPLKAGTKVFLKFSLHVDDVPIEVAAEVMRAFNKKRGPGRHKPLAPGIGLKFLSLSQKDFRKIEHFISGE